MIGLGKSSFGLQGNFYKKQDPHLVVFGNLIISISELPVQPAHQTVGQPAMYGIFPEERRRMASVSPAHYQRFIMVLKPSLLGGQTPQPGRT